MEDIIITWDGHRTRDLSAHVAPAAKGDYYTKGPGWGAAEVRINGTLLRPSGVIFRPIENGHLIRLCLGPSGQVEGYVAYYPHWGRGHVIEFGRPTTDWQSGTRTVDVTCRGELRIVYDGFLDIPVEERANAAARAKAAIARWATANAEALVASTGVTKVEVRVRAALGRYNGPFETVEIELPPATDPPTATRFRDQIEMRHYV